MIKLSTIIVLVTTFYLAGCKKGYTCYCTDPGGMFDYYNIHDTKKNATQKCKEYYDANYAGVPMNEVSCELETK